MRRILALILLATLLAGCSTETPAADAVPSALAAGDATAARASQENSDEDGATDVAATSVAAEVIAATDIAPVETASTELPPTDAPPTVAPPTEAPTDVPPIDTPPPVPTEGPTLDGVPVSLTAEGIFVLGQPDAPVTVLDYGDFQ